MFQYDFVTSQLVWKPIVVQYATYTGTMWELEASNAHKLKMDFTVGDVLHLVVKLLKLNDHILKLFRIN